jgi:manganese oxidase
MSESDISRRELFRRGAGTAAATAIASAGMLALSGKAEACSKCKEAIKGDPPPNPYVKIGAPLHNEFPVDMDRTGAPDPVFSAPPDAAAFLTHFDYGKVSKGKNGQTIRDYVMVGTEKDFEISPGVTFPGWTYNDSIPGPTLRCTEGDRLRVHFYNHTTRDHTIHLHGIHPAEMDGSFEIVPPGGYFRYEFDADPFGCFLYHCHMTPLRKHIARGMFGVFVVDPKEAREPAHEMVMMMHGFDVDMTGEANSFYAVNGPAFYYRDNPIEIKRNQLVRIYLANITEIDLINSFHLHANMFKLFRTGTRLDHYEITDTVMMCQGERAILEFRYKYTGDYLFHAHQNEFAERGWLGIFRVID